MYFISWGIEGIFMFFEWLISHKSQTNAKRYQIATSIYDFLLPFSKLIFHRTLFSSVVNCCVLQIICIIVRRACKLRRKSLCGISGCDPRSFFDKFFFNDFYFSALFSLFVVENFSLLIEFSQTSVSWISYGKPNLHSSIGKKTNPISSW